MAKTPEKTNISVDGTSGTEKYVRAGVTAMDTSSVAFKYS